MAPPTTDSDKELEALGEEAGQGCCRFKVVVPSCGTMVSDGISNNHNNHHLDHYDVPNHHHHHLQSSSSSYSSPSSEVSLATTVADGGGGEAAADTAKMSIILSKSSATTADVEMNEQKDQVFDQFETNLSIKVKELIRASQQLLNETDQKGIYLEGQFVCMTDLAKIMDELIVMKKIERSEKNVKNLDDPEFYIRARTCNKMYAKLQAALHQNNFTSLDLIKHRESVNGIIDNFLQKKDELDELTWLKNFLQHQQWLKQQQQQWLQERQQQQRESEEGKGDKEEKVEKVEKEELRETGNSNGTRGVGSGELGLESSEDCSWSPASSISSSDCSAFLSESPFRPRARTANGVYTRQPPKDDLFPTATQPAAGNRLLMPGLLAPFPKMVTLRKRRRKGRKTRTRKRQDQQVAARRSVYLAQCRLLKRHGAQTPNDGARQAETELLEGIFATVPFQTACYFDDWGDEEETEVVIKMADVDEVLPSMNLEEEEEEEEESCSYAEIERAVNETLLELKKKMDEEEEEKED